MKKPESEQLFANALNTIPELGPIRLTKILNFFGSYEAAFNKSASQYINAGLEANISNSIAEKMRNINPEEEYEKTKKHNIRILLNSDPAFPQLLKEIIPSPPLLYIRGDLSVLNNYCLGIVGTRKISNYGLRILSELIPILVTHKITIVSGLAFGTDAAALEETIRCGGQTISILPSPVDDNSFFF